MPSPWISIKVSTPKYGDIVDVWTDVGRFTDMQYVSKNEWPSYWSCDFFVRDYESHRYLDSNDQPEWMMATRVAETNVLYWMPRPEEPKPDLTTDAGLTEWFQNYMKNHPDQIREYRDGKKSLIGIFVGNAMKASRNEADPILVITIIQDILTR